jgi:hypothetical protein
MELHLAHLNWLRDKHGEAGLAAQCAARRIAFLRAPICKKSR